MFDIVFTHYDEASWQVTGEVCVRGPFVAVSVYRDVLRGHFTQPVTAMEKRRGGRVIAHQVQLTKGAYWVVKNLGEEKCYTGWCLEPHSVLEPIRPPKRRTIIVENRPDV